MGGAISILWVSSRIKCYAATCRSTGSGTGALLVKHLSERPVPVTDRAPDVPAWLGRVTMRLLEKQPSDRFGDASALVRALEQGDAGPAMPATQGQPVQPPQPAAPRPFASLVPPPALPMPAAPVAGVPATAGAPVSDVERVRWEAGPVVRFRRSLTRWGIFAGLFALSAFFTGRQ